MITALVTRRPKKASASAFSSASTSALTSGMAKARPPSMARMSFPSGPGTSS